MQKDKVIIYSQGLVAMSVCVDKKLRTEEIEELCNLQSPTGIKPKWKISEAKKFSDGKTPNPCPCDTHPDSRMHYLLNC